MFEDWLDILLRGTYETSLPTLTVTSRRKGSKKGDGARFSSILPPNRPPPLVPCRSYSAQGTLLVGTYGVALLREELHKANGPHVIYGLSVCEEDKRTP